MQKACDDFKAFCLKHFGAEKEPLIYEQFGKDLKVLEEDSWLHVSENSACVAWETNLPATSFVEYGETAEYGKKTDETDRPYAIHLHYLKGLETGKTYHYRLVSVDERGNRIVSADGTLTPKKIDGAVRIPDDLQEAPYVLDRKGATYVLTRDIRTQGAAIRIAVGGVTLDLNGHTILYDQKDGVPSGAYPANIPPVRGVGHGIIMEGYNVDFSDVRILNGTIRQGDGGGEGSNVGWGFNPLMTTGAKHFELAGITAVYHGSSISGLTVRGPSGGSEIHHNVVEDRGTEIKNRHQGLDALHASTRDKDPTAVRVHHNLVRRARHRGIRASAGVVDHNEIYIDSHATNSYGIMFYGPDTFNVTARANRIFGTGYHTIGISVGWVTGAKIENNAIVMVASKPSGRWEEYGELSGANGIRIWGNDNAEIVGNRISVRNAEGRGTGLRGFWVYWKNTGPKNTVIRGNTVKMIVTPDSTDAAYAVVAGDGSDVTSENPEVAFVDNTFISNVCCVTLGDGYCPYSYNKRFVGNTFVRAGDDPRYCTIRAGHSGYPTGGSVFIDSRFEGGAGYDTIRWMTGGERELSVGWTLTVKTAPGARIVVKDREGKEAVRANANADGQASFPVIESTWRMPRGQKEPQRVSFTPHTVEADRDGRRARATVAVDAPKTITLTLDQE